jgi:hypothetical protein
MDDYVSSYTGQCLQSVLTILTNRPQACFAGGNLLLGGKYLNRPDFTDLGLKVTDSCHWLYNSTTTGLGPSSKTFFLSLIISPDKI